MENVKLQLYIRLCNQFGEDDIVPDIIGGADIESFDFYIVSKNCYVDCFGDSRHGSHWYDATNVTDHKKVDMLKKERDQTLYLTWTVMDCRKRMWAETHQLNYVVFWDSLLRDFDLWSSMDCPNGQDWKEMYSWLPNRVIDNMTFQRDLKWTGTPFNLSLFAKKYQFREFYHRELLLWKQNPIYKDLPLHLYLYINRLQYLHKNPLELSDIEILRGLSISGVCKNYSVFHTGLMEQVLEKYAIQSVLDPCAGWGERMLCCYKHNLVYYGVDINSKLQRGYEKMIQDFHLDQQHIVFGDAVNCLPNVKCEAVITCPPYGNTEIYSEYGSENLSKDAFLMWWTQVILQCKQTGVRYFCFQINQKWKVLMAQCVEQCGFQFLEELKDVSLNKSSHFHRRNGENHKKEYESMLVYECIH